MQLAYIQIALLEHTVMSQMYTLQAEQLCNPPHFRKGMKFNHILTFLRASSFGTLARK